MAEATIRDVAREAQVSVASVSRVLNRLDNVSEETKARVIAAVDALGYVPHAGARSLSLARTNAIGVVLPALHGEFFSEIVRGMDEIASARSYFLLLSNMHPESSGGTDVLRAMRGRVDGLLLMAPHVHDQLLVEALPKNLPTLLINTRGRPAELPGIHLDNAAGARAVAEHLLSLGRRRIVHIAGPQGNIDAQERAETERQQYRSHQREHQQFVCDCRQRSAGKMCRRRVAVIHAEQLAARRQCVGCRRHLRERLQPAR